MMPLDIKILTSLLMIFSMFCVILCDFMKDPYDMEIFSSGYVQKFESSEKNPEQNMDYFVQQSSCEVSNKNKFCDNFLHTLLRNIDQQLFIEELDGKDLDITLTFSLSAEDIKAIKERHEGASERSHLCSLLEDSIEREPFESKFSNVLNFFLRLLKGVTYWICQTLSRINFYQINLKDFIVLSWVFTFISCFFIFLAFRSVFLTMAWIMFCIIFVSTYTTYEHMYQSKVAEREAMMLALDNSIPHECYRPERSILQKFKDYFTGQTPVWIPDQCEHIFKKINISPEIEIKFSDALAKTVSGLFFSVLESLFDSASSVATKVSEKHSWISKWMVYWVIFAIVLFFGVIIFGQLIGQELTFFGISLRPNSNRTTHYPAHREFIETVPSPSVSQIPTTQVLPSPGWIHEFIELRANSLNYQQVQTSETENAKKSTFEPQLKTKHVYKKMKTVGLLTTRPSNELVVRRSSF